MRLHWCHLEENSWHSTTCKRFGQATNVWDELLCFFPSGDAADAVLWGSLVMFSVNFATWNVCEFLVNKIVLFICVVIQHVSEAQFEQCHARTPKWTNKPFAEDRAGWSCTVRGFLRDGRHPPEHPSKHLRPHWKHVSRTVGNPDSLESSQSKQGPICRTGLQFGKRQVYKSKRFKMWNSTQDTKAKSRSFFKAFSAGKKKAYCDFLQPAPHVH